jgi:hypothetical protein
MSNDQTREAGGEPVVKRYERYGLFGGIAFGLLIGSLIVGPHIDEWSAILSLAVISGCTAGAATFGYFARALADGSLAAGAGSGADFTDVSDSSTDGIGGDGGSSGGGDSDSS